MEQPTNPLLASPTDAQLRLLELVWAAFLENRVWPKFQYVEGCLGADGVNAAAVLSSFPIAGQPGTMPHYRAVWFEHAGSAPINPDRYVALTVAGLRHVEDGPDYVHTILKVLKFMVEHLRATHFSPIQLVEVLVSSDELSKADRLLEAQEARSQLFQLLKHEFSLLRPTAMSGSGWHINLHPDLRRFEDIKDVADYLDRVASYMTPETVAPLPRYTSPLTLPDALGYLDAVWRLRFSEPLVKLPGVGQAARLAVEVGSVEEFQSGLSALGEILAGLQLPAPANGRYALERLQMFLAAQLMNANTGRINDAIATLDAIRLVRNGLQHSDATQKAIRGLRVLDIQYPIADWSEAWNLVRARATQAVDALRDEIQASK